MASWKNAPLEKVCNFINRGISPAYLDNGGIAVLNQKCVRDHEVNFDLGRRHDAETKKVSPERLLRAGDVLVNSTGTGTLGRVAQLRTNPEEATTVDSHVTIVRSTPGLFVPEFFGYAMVAIEEQIQQGGEGCGGQTELARSKLANDYSIVFPDDHSEQRRIVAILDEAFDAIATAKTNAEKNLQSAQKLLDNYLETLFSSYGPEWQTETLGNITTLARGHNPPKSKFSMESKPGYVRFYQIRDGSSDEYAVYVPDTPQLHKMKADDIMMVAYRHVGRVFRGVEGAFNVALCKIGNARRDLLHDDYLFNVLTSRHVKGELLKRSERSLIPSMSIEHLRELTIPLPPLAEQGAIVDGINAISTECQRLISIQRRKATALDELKKSLLHQAFTGMLTAKPHIAEFEETVA